MREQDVGDQDDLADRIHSRLKLPVMAPIPQVQCPLQPCVMLELCLVASAAAEQRSMPCPATQLSGPSWLCMPDDHVL